MDNDAFLSLSTRSRVQHEPPFMASPVLELIFAGFYISRLDASVREPLEWAQRLLAEKPELAETATELLGDVERGKLLFGLALDLDYYADEDARRFLADLPGLAEEMREAQRLEARKDAEPEPEPIDADYLERATDLLSALWEHLGPIWSESAGAVAELAATEAMDRLEETGDVMEALPRRHFVQFEEHSAEMREEHQRGRLRIVPLVFAAGGGFHIKGERLTAVGFGMHAEQVHRAMEDTVVRAAARAKIFSDPTRLMLLNLLMRYEPLSMTVGDIARQLGVSQPTVSGHLKLLKDGGLVEVVKKGNRTYPKANEEAIREAGALLQEALRKRY